MSFKSTLISGTLINSFSTVFISLVQVLLIPLLINGLGVYEFGLLGIISIFSINGYISIFDLGLPSSVQRYVSKYSSLNDLNSVKSLISSSLTLLLLVGTLLSLFLFFTSFIISANYNLDIEYQEKFIISLQIFALSYIVQFPTLVLQNALLGLLKFGHSKIILCFIEAIKLTGVFIILKQNGDLIDIIALYVSLELLSFLLSLSFVFKHLGVFNILKMNKGLLVSVRKFTGYQWSGKIVSIIYNQSDRIFISIFLSPMVVSSFEVMMKFPSLVNKFLGLSMSAIVPSFGSLNAEKDSKIVSQVYKSGFKSYALFIVPLIVFISVNSRDLLTLWVGKNFVYLSGYIQLCLIWSLISVLTFGSFILVGLNIAMRSLLFYRLVQMGIKIVSLYALIESQNLLAIPISFILSMLPVIYLLKVFKKNLNLDVWFSLKELFKNILISVLIIYCSKLALFDEPVDNFLDLGVYAFIIIVLSWYVTVVVGWKKEERNVLINNLRFKKYEK